MSKTYPGNTKVFNGRNSVPFGPFRQTLAGEQDRDAPRRSSCRSFTGFSVESTDWMSSGVSLTMMLYYAVTVQNQACACRSGDVEMTGRNKRVLTSAVSTYTLKHQPPPGLRLAP